MPSNTQLAQMKKASGRPRLASRAPRKTAISPTTAPLALDRSGRVGQTEILRYAFLRGQGGALVFVWTVGLALFIPLLNLPLFAVLWTLATLGLGVMMVRNYSNNDAVQALVIRAITESNLPIEDLSDAVLRTNLHKSIDIYMEIVQKVSEIRKLHGVDPDLRQVLVDSFMMLSMQFETSKQAEELERALSLIDATDRMASPAQSPHESTRASRLYQQSLAAIEKEAAEARSLAGEIFKHLETLLLQVFQMEWRASDIVQIQEFARQSEETIKRMQDQVHAQREAAVAVLDLITPEEAVRPGLS
jgi:hypothetical protein